MTTLFTETTFIQMMTFDTSAVYFYSAEEDYIIKVEIKAPFWPVVTEGADSGEYEAITTPSGLSGTTYSWSWEPMVASGGNNPSVTFSSPNSSTTRIERAHWYAVPDARCASNQVAEYRIWCTVAFEGFSCSNSAAFSVKLVDPAAMVIPEEMELTGSPSTAFNEDSNLWYVSGPNTLARQVTVTTNWFLHANSQFTAKMRAHEDQHTVDIINGFDGHEFVTVDELYARIAPLTDTTQTGLVAQIVAEWNQYYLDEQIEYDALRPGFEVRAYNVSDGEAPDYYYSNCGRYTYP